MGGKENFQVETKLTRRDLRDVWINEKREDNTQTKIPEGGIMVLEQREASWLVTIGHELNRGKIRNFFHIMGEVIHCQYKLGDCRVFSSELVVH